MPVILTLALFNFLACFSHFFALTSPLIPVLRAAAFLFNAGFPFFATRAQILVEILITLADEKHSAVFRHAFAAILVPVETFVAVLGRLFRTVNRYYFLFLFDCYYYYWLWPFFFLCSIFDPFDFCLFYGDFIF